MRFGGYKNIYLVDKPWIFILKIIHFYSPGYFGRKCECNSLISGGREQHKEKCRDPLSNEICNKNGKCECGKCKCGPQHVGKFCACDKRKCPRYDIIELLNSKFYHVEVSPILITPCFQTI